VLDLAGDLREMARRSDARLWINDRIDVALVIRADGVQLGARSLDPDGARRVLGRSCWIGRSIHTSEEVGLVEADVYVLGNIFETASHPERAALGVAAVREAARFGRPIVAIGGITPERTREVVEAGAWGIAVSSGVWGARDPAAAMVRYARALDEAECVGSVSNRTESNG
jgi:thiamine-phosphate diphosphorylase